MRRDEDGKRRRTVCGRKAGAEVAEDGCGEQDKSPGPVKPAGTAGALRVRALGSVTNITRMGLIQEADITSAATSSTALFQDAIARSSASPVMSLPKTPTKAVSSSASQLKQESTELNMLRTPVSMGKRTPERPKSSSRHGIPSALRIEPKSTPAATDSTVQDKIKQPQIDSCMEVEGEDLTTTQMGVFLQNAFVWLAKPHGSSRPSWRAPSRAVIPAGQQVNTLDALLRACAWCDTGQPARKWVERGVIFVDDQDDPKSDGVIWTEYPLKALLERRAALVALGVSTTCKPVWVFSTKMLSFDELRNFAGNIEDRAICRIG